MSPAVDGRAGNFHQRRRRRSLRLTNSGAGTSTIVLGNAAAPSATVLTIGGGNGNSYLQRHDQRPEPEQLGGHRRLTKTGTGTLTLAARNTYTGGNYAQQRHDRRQ